MLTQEPNKKLRFFKREFQQFYKTELRRGLTEAENVRKKFVKTFWVYIALTIADIIALILYFLTARYFYNIIGNDCFTTIALVLTFAPFALFALFLKMYSQYKCNINILVISKLITFFKNFKPENYRLHILPTDILNSWLFHDIENIKNDEYFSGTYKNSDICVSSSKVTKSGIYGAEWRFNGTMAMFGFNKIFPTPLIIRSKKFYWNNTMAKILLIYTPVILSLIIIFSIIFSYAVRSQPIEIAALALGCCLMFVPAIYYAFYLLGKLFKKYRTRTTHVSSKYLEITPEFNKNWNVYTYDKKSAIDFLTPQLAEKLVKIQKLMPFMPIDCSRFEDKFIIAVYSRRFFGATPFFIPLTSYRNLYNQTLRMYMLFDLLEEISAL